MMLDQDVRSMTKTPRARSNEEIRFAASLVPCSACGARQELGYIDGKFNYEMIGGGIYHGITFVCATCREPRKLSFTTYPYPESDLYADPAFYELGRKIPSEIISPTQFAEVLAALLPQTQSDLRTLDHREWRIAHAVSARALTAANELWKLFPEDADRIDGERPSPWFARAAFGTERDRLIARLKAFDGDMPRIHAQEDAIQGPIVLPRGWFGRDEYDAHAAWLRRGRTGDGRFDLAHRKLDELRLSAHDLRGARIEDLVVERAALVGTHLEEAELIDVVLLGTNLQSLLLDDAIITGGSFAGSNFALAQFTAARITKSDFRSTDQTRTYWMGARVRESAFAGAAFVDARLDGAKFTSCDLRAAQFENIEPRFAELCTTRGTVFEDCDLRDTLWTGRDLGGARFVRCQLAGAHGTPRARGFILEGCDLEIDELHAQLAQPT